MENEIQQESWVASFWRKNRILFKGFVIGIITLLLLIPTALIMSLINERQGRQNEAFREISAKWAGNQTVSGPVIAIPFLQQVKDDKGRIEQVKEYAYFLPDILDIRGTMSPEERTRGIYKVIVYTSDLKFNGSFGKLDTEALGIDSSKLLVNEAYVLFGLNDIRGIREELRLNINGSDYQLIPGKLAGNNFGNTLLARINLTDLLASRSFSMTLKLRGSESLFFQPLGKKTHVSINSPWSNPSFTGNYLPDQRNISKQGFQADWNILYMNRNFPQQWTGSTVEMEDTAFGVDLLVPVDSYQKSERSVKYAILCILLTFTAFFLIEMIYSRPIHAFQYILVGFALCLFYTLLLSISEYIDFNIAYLIAATATVALIGIYVRSVFQSTRIASFIAGTLVAMYGFIYVLIQSQDYALLMGSIGLFLTLALVMYFSRKAKLE